MSSVPGRKLKMRWTLTLVVHIRGRCASRRSRSPTRSNSQPSSIHTPALLARFTVASHPLQHQDAQVLCTSEHRSVQPSHWLIHPDSGTGSSLRDRCRSWRRGGLTGRSCRPTRSQPSATRIPFTQEERACRAVAAGQVLVCSTSATRVRRSLDNGLIRRHPVHFRHMFV